MRSRNVLSATTALLLLLGACGDDSSTPPIDSAEYEQFRSQPTACDAEQPNPAREMTFATPDDLGVEGEIVATLHTSCGDITIALLADVASATVNSFVFLAEQGYFDGTVSHRIAPGFVVQMGDPTATGHGGPGYRIPDELPTADFSYVTGVVAMANSGPDTGGSQFFIVLDEIDLDPDYTVFGTVTDGLGTLAAIATIPIGTNPNTFEPSLPLETVYIESITIQR